MEWIIEQIFMSFFFLVQAPVPAVSTISFYFTSKFVILFGKFEEFDAVFTGKSFYILHMYSSF